MYQALYRKYRPSTFDDVISQPHITTTLKNQLVSGKTGHCYLFTGSRGTGKTTCARIFAKALICENPKDGEPCLECQTCRDMEAEQLSDVIEIDAASNRGIDDARELREAAIYMPERCKYRIYIIDEVHMLTSEAFNALLKIIEEPPPHVKFIMATTEIHKVLPTILSRCQRFDFRRIRPEDIASRLEYVAEQEKIKLESDAAALIAKAADGGMRDALSILDRCIAFSEDVTAEVVSEAAGIAGRDHLFNMTEAMCKKDISKALDIISDIYECSKDLVKFSSELAEQFRNILVMQNTQGAERLIACMPNELEILKRCAAETPPDYVMSVLDSLGKCSERIGRSTSKRIELEMTVIRICSGNTQQTAQSAPADNSAVQADNSLLAARVAELEQMIRDMQARGVQPVQRAAAKPAESRYASQDTVTDTSKMNKNSIVPLAQWPEILEKFQAVCPSVSGTLHGSQGYVSENYLLIVTDNNFFLSLLRNKENSEKLLETVRSVTGRTYTIRAKCTAPRPGSTENKLPALLKKAEEDNIPVDTEK